MGFTVYASTFRDREFDLEASTVMSDLNGLGRRFLRLPGSEPIMVMHRAECELPDLESTAPIDPSRNECIAFARCKVQSSLNPLISLGSFLVCARRLARRLPVEIRVFVSDDFGVVSNSGLDARSISLAKILGILLVGVVTAPIWLIVNLRAAFR